MDNKKIASQLLFMAREVLGMDFPTQDAFDKYMKDHPDANRSNHKVVKHDPSKPETPPMNLMQQRKNEEKMKEIGKHYKKDPKDLTNDEIVKFNQGKNVKKTREIGTGKKLFEPIDIGKTWTIEAEQMKDGSIQGTATNADSAQTYVMGDDDFKNVPAHVVQALKKKMSIPKS